MMFKLITMDKPGGRSVKKNSYSISSIFREKIKGWQVTVIDTFVEEFHDFIALTKGDKGSGVIATGEDGYRATEIANAVYQSSKSGQAVTLSEET